MRTFLSARLNFIFLLTALALPCLAGCKSAPKLPAKNSREYNDTVRAFYVGLAALQVGDDVRAESELTKATQLAPDEPASWANLGLLSLRQRNLDAAGERLEKARTLAPDNSRIHVLLATLESTRGRLPEAISNLRKAIELDAQNIRALYMLAEELERQGDEQSGEEAQKLFAQILQTQPDNLAVQLELTRIAAKRNDSETVKSAIGRLSERSGAWPAEVQQQFKALQEAAAGTDMRAAATRVAFLRNVLVRVPEYRQSFSAVKTPPGEDAEPFTRFIKLETPAFSPAPPDEALTFNAESIPEFQSGKWNWIGALSLNGEGAPVVMVANGREVRLATGATLPFPGGGTAKAPLRNGVLPVDFNYDFKTDLVLAGAGGLRFFKQDSPSAFADVTAQTKLPASLTNSYYIKAWAADIEADGDMDIIVTPLSGDSTALRNNGDGTFKEEHPFEGTTGLSDFVWADLDADGDADAALLNYQRRLQIYTNERGGQFRARTMPPDLPVVEAITVADINNDGKLDLILLQEDDVIRRLSDKNEGQDWEMAEVTRLPSPTDGETVFQLFPADIDNNGSLDLLLYKEKLSRYPGEFRCPPHCPEEFVWLSDQSGKFKLLDATSSVFSLRAVSDTNGDGHLDLLGFTLEGDAWNPVRLINRGSKNYHWQQVRPRAKQATGDQRINSFGVGGEMEIRAGLLVQKQLITGPVVHFGLGEQTGADVVRIVWPNGSVRAEFDLKADQAITAEQRLKGSCPFLFAYNGKEMDFVKDCQPWGPAIGLDINTFAPGARLQTEEWFKIRGDQLVARDNFYELRITAELWETYYFDHLSLMVVDHPLDTDIFVDERFSIPPPPLAVRNVTRPRAVNRATDDKGQNVTETVRSRDGKYLDTFGKGQYQGLTRDHFVEVDLEDAPKDGQLWLIAHGWVHPTDASINVAIMQGSSEKPKDLSLEVPDGKGGWAVVKSKLGFPAGRLKTVLFDLKDVFRPNTPRRVRLRTNLEIYWDSLEWAVGLPDDQIKTERLNLNVAELRYRGFSVINQANESSPQIPEYNHLEGTTQRWRDLVGYYTRFGDVRELLTNIDDRIVLMNAGDELMFRFAAPSPPPAGWVRDFVLIGDGWIKDGDLNSLNSKTVLPLPAHDIHDYTKRPGRLEDDPVYQRHAQDWLDYHTRYVTPDSFQNRLRIK